MSYSYNNLVNNLSNDLQRNFKLEKLITHFQKYYNLVPVIGVEIEFYLSSNINLLKFEILVRKYSIEPKILKVKKEKGLNQFEIDLAPSSNLIEYIEQIAQAKLVLIKAASELGGDIDFSSKPFLNDYGSSMHFHVNFLSSNSSNLKEYLELAAKGLCYYMQDTFLVFMPNADDYLRLDRNFMAPTHVSFGGNNRTVAVRIPNSTPARLEHRLSSSVTDSYIAIFTIFKSILLAFRNPSKVLPKFTKIYGNAYDAQYNLKMLPKTLEESFKLFKSEFYNDESWL